MREKFKVFGPFLSACLSFLMLAATIFAWFAMNKQVDSTGMQMQVEASPNLIIVKTPEAVATADSSSISIDFTDMPKNQYIPVTHIFGDTPTSSTGLGYNTNATVIDKNTGLPVQGGSVSLAGVDGATVSNKNYFMDYTVYIASTGKPLEITSLIAEMSIVGDLPSEPYKAISIDFLVNDTYTETLNLAGFDARLNDYTTAKTSATLVQDTNLSDENKVYVPLNTAASNNYIKVTMRCYFDGALLSANGHAYINSNELTTTEALVFNVKFTANTPA